MCDIASNLMEVKRNIVRAAEKAGRNPEEITLIAVSKNVDTERINFAAKAGIKNFGENKAQELREKYDKIEEPVNWHFIGHLQSNKVKYIIDKVVLIHSLDRLSLAKEIDKRAGKMGKTADALVQVNVADEESKFGISVDEAEAFIEEVVTKYSNINIKGLMTLAPYVDNPEEVRPVFAKLRDLKQYLSGKKLPRTEMKYLSMGMTNDYTVAIEEGANMVRIGTAIFGARNQ